MAVVVAKGSAAGIMIPATSEARRLQTRPLLHYCPRLARGWATGAPAELTDGPLRRRDHGHDYAARQATTNYHRTSPVRATDGRRKMNGAAHASTTSRKLMNGDGARRQARHSTPARPGPEDARAQGQTGTGGGRHVTTGGGRTTLTPTSNSKYKALINGKMWRVVFRCSIE